MLRRCIAAGSPLTVMIASERNLYILKRINDKGVINIKDVARELNISETTVRRDFEKLEQKGKLRRVQGGATLNSGEDEALESAELTMSEKGTLNHAEKLLVASHAARLVKDGDCVFLDAGTSIAPMAELLMQKNIRLVTYSTLFLKSIKNPVAEIYMIGGQYLPHYNMFLGLAAEEMLEKFQFDHAFIGCFGLSLDIQKAYTVELKSANMKRIAMKHARQSYLLADHTKFSKTGFYSFAAFEEFDKIFCDKPGTLQDLPGQFELV